MTFILFFQYLGDHVPALGAFLVCLLVVGIFGLVMYKLGFHKSGVLWKQNVKQMPRVIEQSIVQEYELAIARRDERIKWLQERYDEVAPVIQGIRAMAEHVAATGK